MDIGFGDVIIPQAMQIKFPTLFEENSLRIRFIPLKALSLRNLKPW